MTRSDREWFENISDDPNEPSEMPIAHSGDIKVYDTTITVMPGEKLLAYRHEDNLVFIGFVGVTLQ